MQGNMKFLIKTFAICFPFVLSAHAEGTFPFKVLVVGSKDSVQIELSRKQELIEIAYSALGNGNAKTVKHSFSKPVADEIFLNLKDSLENVANWKSDTSCLQKDHWNILWDTHKKEFCTSKDKIEKIAAFQRTVIMVMHGYL